MRQGALMELECQGLSTKIICVLPKPGPKQIPYSIHAFSAALFPQSFTVPFLSSISTPLNVDH